MSCCRMPSERFLKSHHPQGSRKRKCGFVPVVPVGNAASAILVMPNGFRLELQGGVDRALLLPHRMA